MSVDEIDTVLLLRTRSLTDSGQKPIFAAELHANRQINWDEKSSSLQNRNIISTFLKKLIFTKEINCHFEDQCEDKLG